MFAPSTVRGTMTAGASSIPSSCFCLAAIGRRVFWFTDVSLPSPLMRVMGFRFYKTEASNGMVYTLISNRQIMDPKDVRWVKKISASMLLEVIK